MESTSYACHAAVSISPARPLQRVVLRGRFARSRAAPRAGTLAGMTPDSGYTVSVWMNTADAPALAPLEANATADVSIVGAGIAGLSTASFLAREGRPVIVLDDGPITGGETSRTTAHLSF